MQLQQNIHSYRYEHLDLMKLFLPWGCGNTTAYNGVVSCPLLVSATSVVVWCAQRDGCVATLVRARRTEGDVCAVPGGAGSAARAVLVAYRVLAPRLVLRLIPCARSATYHDGQSPSH